MLSNIDSVVSSLLSVLPAFKLMFRPSFHTFKIEHYFYKSHVFTRPVYSCWSIFQALQIRKTVQLWVCIFCQILFFTLISTIHMFMTILGSFDLWPWYVNTTLNYMSAPCLLLTYSYPTSLRKANLSIRHLSNPIYHLHIKQVPTFVL